MNAVNRSFAALLGCALTVTFAAQAQDWPQWRGPNRDGRVTGFKAPATWPKELKQAWKVEIGNGVATPALVGNRLYTFSRQDPNEIVRCLDATTGKELWSDKSEALAPTGGAGGYPGPRSSPTVAEGKVVTYGVRGTLTCFEAESGKILWRKESTTGSWPTFFTSSSPLIVNGLCIAQLGNDQEGSITAFDLNSGDEKWKWSGDGTAYASPVPMELGGTRLIIAQSAKRVVALDAANGKLMWETPFAVQGRGNNTATPIIDGDLVIYAGSGRGATAVKLSKQGEAISATELWKNADNSVQFNSPVLTHGLVIGLNQANELFCINAETGKTAWTAPTSTGQTPAPAGPPPGAGPGPGAGRGPEGGPGGGPGGGRGPGGRGGGRGPSGFGSVLAAGSVALALTQNPELIVFEPKADGFKELARIKVADSPTHAYPILSGNRIFIKDQNSVALLTLD